GDPAELITRYALPKLYKLEQEYGSFITGTIKKGFKKKTSDELKVTRKVFSVKGGLSSLTEALYKLSGKDSFILGVSDLKPEYKEGKFHISFSNSQNENITIIANKLITTSGAFSLDTLLTFIDNESLSKITNLKYANVVEVILGFKNWNGMNPDGFGGLIPSIEKRDLLGVLFMSSLFANRTPENGTLFTLFLGGMRKPEMYNKSENEIKAIVEKEFVSLMKPSEFEPELFKINYHKNAIPQYGIDSGERFDMVDKLENQYKGLIIGGNLKGGIGMADRIKQGKELAVRACG
ncbi:MAG: protoporphyrinogen oxidase, partial [Bacteroidetes bacterium GWA2_30_7]